MADMKERVVDGLRVRAPTLSARQPPITQPQLQMSSLLLKMLMTFLSRPLCLPRSLSLPFTLSHSS